MKLTLIEGSVLAKDQGAEFARRKEIAKIE